MHVKIEIPRDEIKKFVEEITANKNFLYMFIPCSIGDFLIAAGLSYAVQQRKNKSSTILIAQDRMKNLSVNYPNVVDVIYLPMDLLKAVDTLIQGTQSYEWDNFIYGNIHTVDGKIIWDKGLSFLDCYKKTFKLPLDTPLMPPLLKSISAKNIADLKFRYVLDRRRTIIILPHAKTFSELDETFWETLTRRLNKKSYVVYTNVANENETTIKGTEPIMLNFSELNFVTGRVKCFIGLRSGALDFLAMTPAQIFSIAKFPKWEGDLSIIYDGCNNKTFYDAVEYKKPLEDYLTDKGLSPKIEINHKHISAKDIYFSYEDIMNGILAEVEKI